MMNVVLGLGTNSGDRLGNLRQCIRALKARESGSFLKLQTVSPIYESNAMLPEGAPSSWNLPFLNLCLRGQSDRQPEELLEEVKRIERSMGRLPWERWAPRVIDLDILAMDSLVFRSETLTVPHPGLRERPFAILPFADLWPEWEFPGAGLERGVSAARFAKRWEMGMPGVPFHTRKCPLFLPEFMGILNVTPDSFSDGGKFLDAVPAARQAAALREEGATVLDVGAESTRPGAVAVDPETEWRRLAPVLEKVRGLGLKISVDTRHASVARQAIESGADWINDVSGAAEPEMRRVLASSGAELVIMHSLTVPPRREVTLPAERDPVVVVLEWAERRISGLEGSGLPRGRIIFDPGIGFGKTPEQNLRLLREIRKFQALGVRILVGHSRKSFLGNWVDTPAEDRDLESATISQYLASQGVDYLRVHNVGMGARMLRTSALLGGRMEL